MSADAALPMARRLAPFALALSLGACDWFTDFKDQPRIEPWESYALLTDDTAAARRIPFRGQPQASVPVTGTVAPGYWVSYAPLPATLDTLAQLDNPIAPSVASLLNGQKYYQINCAVCHGVSGQGNGPATLYGMVGISLTSANALGLSDGYIFGIIRNGRGVMPTYNRIPEEARWDVVNYIRGLQGRYAVDTLPLGRPGVTGDSLPLFTRTAPTRPAPYAPENRIVDTAAARGAPLQGAGLPAGNVPGVPQETIPPGTTPATPPTPTPATPPDTSAQPGARL